eukprot:gene14352-16934_t
MFRIKYVLLLLATFLCYWCHQGDAQFMTKIYGPPYMSTVSDTDSPTSDTSNGVFTDPYRAYRVQFKFPAGPITPWIVLENLNSQTQNFSLPAFNCVPYTRQTVSYISKIMEDDQWPMRSSILVRLSNPPRLSSPAYSCLLNGANKCSFIQMALYEPWFKVNFASINPPTGAPVNITFYPSNILNTAVYTSFLAYPTGRYMSPSTTTIGDYYFGKTQLSSPASIPFYATINNLNSRVGMYDTFSSQSSLIPLSGTPSKAIYNLFTPLVKTNITLQMKSSIVNSSVNTLQPFSYTKPVSTLLSPVKPTAIREETILRCFLITNIFAFSTHAVTSFAIKDIKNAFRSDFIYPFGVKSTPGQATPFLFSADLTYPNVTDQYSSPWPYILEYQGQEFTGLVASDLTPPWVDVSNGPGYTTLVFNLSKNDVSLIPEIYFISPSGTEMETWTGKYDHEMMMYVIPIKLGKRLFTRTLNYNITAAPYPLTYHHLYSVHGEDAVLSVLSTFGDEMGPIVSTVTANPSRSIVIPDSPNSVVYGWNLTIQDDTAFSNGIVFVSSSLDMEPWSRSFTSAQLVNGVFSFTRSITGLCASQTLKLDVILYDTLGNRATSQPTTTPTTQAFMKILNTPIEDQLSISLVCQMPLDTVLPEMNGFRVITPVVDVSSINRTVSFEITATDNGVGLASDIMYAPKVFLMSHLADQIAIPCSGTSSPYQCTGMLPYGYGQSGVALSVYGIRDAHLNMAGYTTSELKTAGFPFTLGITFSANLPILESHSPITKKGGFIIIRGHLMGSQSDTIKASIDYDGVGTFSATIKITVSLRIPYFISSAQIDPDYSLLIDTNKDDGFCLKKKKLSTGAIVGIVAGAIIAISIAIGVTMLILKRRRTAAFNRNLSVKLANGG